VVLHNWGREADHPVLADNTLKQDGSSSTGNCWLCASLRRERSLEQTTRGTSTLKTTVNRQAGIAGSTMLRLVVLLLLFKLRSRDGSLKEALADAKSLWWTIS
jgi:hypothetical protein